MPPNNGTAAQDHAEDVDDNNPHRDLVAAEHLECNDDLCSSILVDQIGCERLKEGRLGVHHQQAKFVGPSIVSSEVLSIIRKVIKGSSSVNEAVHKVSELPVMRDHIASKHTKRARDNVAIHIALYLSVYAPTSRLEIWRTDRYTEVSGHSELGVYATATIPPEQILHEIQGQCADIPAWWMGRSDSDNESGDSDNDERPSRVRRSLRTGRRDFSIIKSNRSKKQQLFLGPARFINHDCNPNVELTVIAKNRISFKSKRRILIGEELTTSYGDHYFDKNNSSCMCLTCEKNGSGHYKTQGPRSDELDSRSQSRAASPGTSQRGGNNYADDSDDGETAASPGSDDETETGRKYRPFRQVRNNSTKLNFTKRRLKDTFIPQRAPVDDPSAERCITCVDPLTDRYWTPGSGAGWDKFCPRCTRHALIFKMPWPAHNKDQIKQYPPQHLVPMNYTPKIIHSEPLPSLEPARKRQATPATNIELIARDLNLPAATKQDRAHWAFLKQWAAEDAILEQQRVQQWEWQEEHDKLAEEMARQREERKQQRLQEKLDRDKNKIRGTGLWSRYEVIADEEIERRIAEKNTVVTGTRSGRRFTVAKSDDEDEDLIARAQEALNKDRERELQAQAKAREYREEAKKRDEAKRREVEKQQRRQAILAKVETANAVAGPSRLANGGANCSSIANGANGAHVDARSSRPSPRSSPRKSHPDHDGPSPARVRTPERPPGYDPRPFPKFIVTPSPPIFTARKRGSIPGTATEPIDLTIDDEDDGLDNELAEVERASPIDLTKSDDDFAPRPAPMSLRRITFKTFNVAPPRNLPPPSPTKSTASPIPAKRGPGRPPGSGRKQQLEKKRREREAAKAVADHDPRDPSSSSSSVPSKSDIDSVDEASPRSAEDDIDSQNSMSSGEFDAPVSASSSTAPTSTSLGKRKQPPTDDDSVATKPRKRTFFNKALKGIRLPTVVADPPRLDAPFRGPT